MREWAYARAYDTSGQRPDERPGFLVGDNWQRPHIGIKGQTPISRISSAEDNLSSIHT